MASAKVKTKRRPRKLHGENDENDPRARELVELAKNDPNKRKRGLADEHNHKTGERIKTMVDAILLIGTAEELGRLDGALAILTDAVNLNRRRWHVVECIRWAARLAQRRAKAYVADEIDLDDVQLVMAVDDDGECEPFLLRPEELKRLRVKLCMGDPRFVDVLDVQIRGGLLRCDPDSRGGRTGLFGPPYIAAEWSTLVRAFGDGLGSADTDTGKRGVPEAQRLYQDACEAMKKERGHATPRTPRRGGG